MPSLLLINFFSNKNKAQRGAKKTKKKRRN